MTCYSPLSAFQSHSVNSQGKRSIYFQYRPACEPVQLPCGQCIGCRLERSRQWAMRCMHEASLHERNCYLTLTYSPEHLPARGNLVLRDWQLFFKRLRKKYGEGIRFFHCGEYGEKEGRPHYHACVFGFDFEDKVFYKMNGEHMLYVSRSLDDLWGKGLAVIGDVTFESAAYVARYIMKKVTGDSADDHYRRVDSDTGEVYFLKPEYTTMSRRPGIGRAWIDKWINDVYPRDEVIVRGMCVKPPKYYDGVFDLSGDLSVVKAQRKLDALVHSDNNTPERLSVREAVKVARIQGLIRPLEKEI